MFVSYVVYLNFYDEQKNEIVENATKLEVFVAQVAYQQGRNTIF